MTSLLNSTNISIKYERDSELWYLKAIADGLKAEVEINKKAMKEIISEVFDAIGTFFEQNPDIGCQNGFIGKIVIDYHDECDSWIIDLTKKPVTVSHDNSDGSITITIFVEYFLLIMSGELTGEDAFMKNRFKMSGNAAHALRLSNLVSSGLQKLKKNV